MSNVFDKGCCGCIQKMQKGIMIYCNHPNDDYGGVVKGPHSYCEQCYKRMTLRIINDEETFHTSGQGLKCLPMTGKCTNVLRINGMFVFIYLFIYNF
jgi:hypothetical protein